MNFWIKLKNLKRKDVLFLSNECMKKFIYADNAATTKLNYDAFEAMKPYLLNEYGNASQPYSFARPAKKALKEARKTIAECINAKPEEIYFTSGGTESDNWAIKGVLLHNVKKNLITSEIEHKAVLNSANSIEKLGYSVKYLKPNSKGIIDPSNLEKNITNNTGLVSIMYANNEIGSIQPIKELCNIAHQNGALFHTDAVQAVGHIKIDVQELGIDLLSASAHKFNGPKGIGFLYIKSGIDIMPYIDGGSQENSFRGGTENVASIVGMACALKNNCDHIDENFAYIKSLEVEFLKNISELNFIKNGGQHTLPGNISISFKGKSGESLLHRLDLKGISVSTGSACNSSTMQISHVLKAIGLNEDYAVGTIRVSIGKENTIEEIHFIANELKKIVTG